MIILLNRLYNKLELLLCQDNCTIIKVVPNSLALIGTIILLYYPKWLMYYTKIEILKSTPLCFFH